jgi:hypothetical protein
MLANDRKGGYAMRFKLTEQKQKYRISYRPTRNETDKERAEKAKAFQYLQLLALNVLSQFKRAEEDRVGPTPTQPDNFQFSADMKLKFDNRYYKDQFDFNATAHFILGGVKVRITNRSIEITGDYPEIHARFLDAFKAQLNEFNTKHIEPDHYPDGTLTEGEGFTYINSTSPVNWDRMSEGSLSDSDHSSGRSSPIDWQTYTNEKAQLEFTLPETEFTRETYALKFIDHQVRGVTENKTENMSNALNSRVACEPNHTARIVCCNIMANKGYPKDQKSQFILPRDLREGIRQFTTKDIDDLYNERGAQDIHGLITLRIAKLLEGMMTLMHLLGFSEGNAGALIHTLNVKGEFDKQKLPPFQKYALGKFFLLKPFITKLNKVIELQSLLNDIRKNGNTVALKNLAENKKSTGILTSGLYSKTGRILQEARKTAQTPAAMMKVNQLQIQYRQPLARH